MKRNGSPAYDVAIVGAGIAGMESALTLGDMGFRVLLVEKEPSVGGKMILLSKVFPTLDCASCISTPKMAAVAHHPMVDLLTWSEVEDVRKEDGGFVLRVRKKSRFVDEKSCTGCGDCEKACPVPIPDRFNFDLAAHRAVHIPFPQAVPKKAVLIREGTSPCIFECPAGVKAHGYIALIRAGKYEEAFRLHMEDAPLPGVLSRACYAPCEGECSRKELEGPLRIRMLKRFMVDRYYESHPEPEEEGPEKRREERVAVVGSGPAGLTAAYYLAREGFQVTIFEAREKAGGMLRYGIPPYRLPREVLERDLKNITSLGVSIRTGERVESLTQLKESFDAVFLAAGAWEPVRPGIEGEGMDGVVDAMTFLPRVFEGKFPRLNGGKVVVIGGGNVAIDSARTALRYGAGKVEILYRRGREEMPAHDWEVDAALVEGVSLVEWRAPARFIGKGNRVVGVEAVKMEPGPPDESGRRRPVPVPGSEEVIPADLVILAIGLKPSTSPFAGEIEVNPDGTVRVDPTTMETSMPGVFAGGDAVTGPSMIIQAVAQGRKAAFFIAQRLIEGKVDPAKWREFLPPPERGKIPGLGENGRGRPDRVPPVAVREIPTEKRVLSMDEVEEPLTEDEAVGEASRCLDCAVCSLCGECSRVCPSGAIDYSMRDSAETYHVKSLVLSTGFRLFDPSLKEQYGFGKYPNVITSMQMDRLLAPTRPSPGVVRPSDGKAPENIAFILCAGSRDRTVSNPFCSRVCCMYSVKQAQLLLGALPLAEVTVYYMDIRAFGKGYEEFFQQAKGMGISFVRGRVAKVEEGPDGNLIVVYEDTEGTGRVVRAEHDLVVLSVGILPDLSIAGVPGVREIERDELLFVREKSEVVNPGATNLEGVFVAGTASGPRDIPDTVLHAGAVSAQVGAYLLRRKEVRS
ncbi:MAG: FAD-dependent oxidoreductase [Deltaproteobacteria bacterium]|nr:MAG: FAD-dependent oxidoreductase [Deltaproteobacteria bacterium]